MSSALRAAGIPGEYVAREVDEAGFAAALDDLRSGRLDGANVTMPHKALAQRSADRSAPEAARAGAVNTLVRVGRAVAGHNTDIAGIREAWERNGLDPEGPVVILGAGGGAAAALLALEGRPLTVAARRPEAAAALVARTGVDASVRSIDEPVAAATVVNATPIGMYGEELPAHLVDDCHGLFEMVYAAGRTPAERAVADMGRPVSTGTDMLIAQARNAFRLWTGREVPDEPLRCAVAAATVGV
jgi:shikimate dehydrogenase